MQKSKSVEKRAKFEILCPDWDENLKSQERFIDLKDKVFHNSKLDGTEEIIRERRLSNGACCIVGEAHD